MCSSVTCTAHSLFTVSSHGLSRRACHGCGAVTSCTYRSSSPGDCRCQLQQHACCHCLAQAVRCATVAQEGQGDSSKEAAEGQLGQGFPHWRQSPAESGGRAQRALSGRCRAVGPGLGSTFEAHAGGTHVACAAVIAALRAIQQHTARS